MKKDHYQTLGVSRNATPAEIKAAYRKLAKDKHPDLFVDKGEKIQAENVFKEITEAYGILSDDRKRRQYDRPTGPPGFGFNFSHANSTTIIFDTPLEVTCRLTIDEAFAGIKKSIAHRKRTKCDSCSGTGRGSETTIIVCPRCQGRGIENIAFISMSCRQCNGSGRLQVAGCGKCIATGTIEVDANLIVDIPPGCGPAHVLRVPGAGSYSKMESRYGDMYVRVNIIDSPHGMYSMSFPHLTTAVPISYKTAVLGGNLTVVTPHGTINVTVPPGISHGKSLKVAGKGMMTSPNSGIYGDLIVTVEIDIPTVNDEGKKLIARLDDDSIVHEGVVEYEAKIANFTI